MGCCSGVVGVAVSPDGSEGSNALHGAINAVEGVVEIARTAAIEASGVLGVLHESVFPDKDVPEGLGPLAGAFDKEGDFLQELVCDSTVSGIETTFMSFWVMACRWILTPWCRLCPSTPTHKACRHLTWHAGFRRSWKSVLGR